MLEVHKNRKSDPHHLKQRQVAFSHVVVVDLYVGPVGVMRDLLNGHAVALVVDLADGEELLCGGVDAAVELTGKQVHPHDAEDEPEDQAHQQHVEDGGNCPYESVHHHLRGKKITQSK